MTNPNDCNFLEEIFSTLWLLASKLVGHNEDDLRIAETWESDTVGEGRNRFADLKSLDSFSYGKNLQQL